MKLFDDKCRIVFVFVLCLFFACSYSKSYTNREKDKIRAQELCESFYTYLKADNYKPAVRLFKDSEMADNAIQSIIDSSENRYGKVQNINIAFTKSFVSEQADSVKGEYVLIYNVERSKELTKEKFVLLSIGETIEIIRYDIESKDKNENAY